MRFFMQELFPPLLKYLLLQSTRTLIHLKLQPSLPSALRLIRVEPLHTWHAS
uniref:Uncharacterized protein n=1 Tax=Arundo donax TaxID=35708 RepID=A0A0A9HGK9_ARUDO